MVRPYLRRTLEPAVLRAAREFPVVVLTGPRQSGKTTLLRHLFPGFAYVALDLPDVKAAAVSDPRGFLDFHPPPCIFDEVQNAPELLPYIRERVDEVRGKHGRYFLTGSQNLLMVKRVTESLAGRAAMLRLLPLSWREASGEPDAVLPWEPGERRSRPFPSAREMWRAFLRGCFPEIATAPERDFSLWHSSYVQTYLERDVRSLRQVGDLTQFQVFLRALAARSAGLLNMSDLARDLGLAINTVKAWISVLEATFQVFILRPYHGNLTKRLVKSPKVYFLDVGTLCHLVGLRDPLHAASGPMAGPIFETAILSELVKCAFHRGLEPRTHFWRTATGVEVDFAEETQEGLVPLEAKLSATPVMAMAAGIKALRQDLPGRALPGYVIHPGESMLPLGPDAVAWPFGRL